MIGWITYCRTDTANTTDTIDGTDVVNTINTRDTADIIAGGVDVACFVVFVFVCFDTCT